MDEESLRKPKLSPVSEEESLRKLRTRTDWLTTPQNVQDIVTNREKLSARDRFFLSTASPPETRRGPLPATHAPQAATNGTNLNDAATRIPVSRAKPARTQSDPNNRNARQAAKQTPPPPKGVLKKPKREVNGEEIDNRPSSETRHVARDKDTKDAKDTTDTTDTPGAMTPLQLSG